MRANFRHLYADIFWYGVLAGSILAFLAVYATRLGASSFQISLLTAGPAWVNLLLSLPFGRWMEGRSVVRASFWSALWHRLGYFVLIPLPWLFAAYLETWMLVWITLVMSIPATLLAIGFNATLAEVVPPELRGEVVGKRNALMSLSMVTTSLSCGVLLDHIGFPANYQVIFGLGALGAMLSTYHLYHLKPTPAAMPEIPMPVEEVQPARPSPKIAWLRLDLLRTKFGPFMLAYFLFYTFQYTAIPIYPLFMVRSLNLTDGEISLGNALYYGTFLIASLGLNRMSTRFGHRKVLVFSALGIGFYPLLLGVAWNATLYWVASFIGGPIWAICNGGLSNRLMERVPADDRPAHMALHNLALNVGILGGSLAGSLAMDWLDIRSGLFLAAGLRFLGGMLLMIWG